MNMRVVPWLAVLPMVIAQYLVDYPAATGARNLAEERCNGPPPLFRAC